MLCGRENGFRVPLDEICETDYRNSMIMTTASFARFEERHINSIILARTDESGENDRNEMVCGYCDLVCMVV